MSGETTLSPKPRDQEFEGQVVVVSGAAQGIGECLVRRLLEQGARVAALDLKQAGLERLAATLDAGERLSLHPLDVADTQAVDQAVAAAEAIHGPIDHLASVAGVLQMGRVVDLEDHEWERALSINAGGPFRLARAVARRMIPRRRGAIVVVSSNAAGTPRMEMGAYAASKAAATQLTRCLGLELAEYGIRCNVVSPGSTDTGMQRGMWADESGRAKVIEGSLASFKAGIPLGKIATPDDVSDAILFLLSPRAGHITLHDLRIDGGATFDLG
ncbi:2,3-dihydro-2,3-dihydroxybenzoate dehydrogenase [Halotalea alkalilenta]|uniref:2,3-dihydro-2,3-dihydroxybenzoate dehydrogenase n=1 Tax=Halotalea alkalilenta TaxID=376489 RepID=UPI0009ED066C|nr:2,3-dihydro-2,3-dihydroxybenzoate dehydrogenase [Halotalea alkalilenta]